MIHREFTHILEQKLHKGKIILLVGPRQVGKTTLINELLKDKDFLFLNGDDASVIEFISQANTEILRNVIGNHKFVFLDEAQRIPNIGLKLKIIADQMKEVQVLVSGSSALDINNMTQEPLTGRKFEYHLFPISWKEFQDDIGYLKAEQQLEIRLLYGMYPDAINHFGEEKEILENLVSSYLYKDILALANIRKPEILEKILRALAFQVGSEVSYNEIAQLVGVDKNTVSHYIDLLEKCFVIFSLHSFSTNLRNEIKTNRKIYFYDNGVRNMILGDFTPFALRQDKGALWENFMISERKKRLNFNRSLARPYFWRTTAQQEVDYLEVTANEIRAFEFKWSDTKKAKLPKPFLDNYSSDFMVVNKKNFRDFVSEEVKD